LREKFVHYFSKFATLTEKEKAAIREGARIEKFPKGTILLEEGDVNKSVSAGIDLATDLSNEIRGEKEAKAAQLMIEYDPKPIFDSGNYLTAEADVIKLAEEKMEVNAKKNLSVWEMVTNVGVLMKLSGKT